jgi:hypothetical protein
MRLGVPYAGAQEWVNSQQSGLSWLSRSKPEAWLEGSSTEEPHPLLRTWLEQALGTLVYEEAAGTGSRLSAGMGDSVAETYGACTLLSLQQHARALGDDVGGVVSGRPPPRSAHRRYRCCASDLCFLDPGDRRSLQRVSLGRRNPSKGTR